ncbi:MAG TPA: hypothetical protein VIU37_02465, partial [Candidatus Limnocylindrales bacterium]
GCYDVVELVPSGLAPLATSHDDGSSGVTWPSSGNGQAVTFCAENGPRTGHLARLRYVARIVNAGTFTWEPAIMTIDGIPEVLTVSGTSVVRIDE